MKSTLTFAIIILFIQASFAKETVTEKPVLEKYSTVRVFFDENFTINDLMNLDFDPECSKIKLGSWAESILPESEIRNLKNKGVKFEIMIPDMQKYYTDRNKKFDKNKIQADEDFKFGSLGGFLTLEEMYAEYDNLIQTYPQYFNGADTIGYSAENRPLVAYNFGNGGSKNPIMLFTGLIHAREPGGMTVTLYFLKKAFRLAQAGNKEYIHLLGNRTIIVIPAVNPDGYKYNEIKAPDGGGLWRKNTRKTSDSTMGVDLNRNFGPYDFWNAPNFGSSTDPKNTTYRGPYPFSEPELQALRKLTMQHNINLAVNYHTFGGYIIHPLAALAKQTEDSAVFRSMNAEFTKVNKYCYGMDMETVGYSTRGDSDDWFYVDDSLKTKVLAITPEVGNQNDGFWPPKERLPEQCLENYDMNRQMLWSAGANIRLKDYETISDLDSLKSFIKLTSVNAGVLKAGQESVLKISSLNNAFKVTDNQRKIKQLSPAERQAETFEVKLTGKPFENGVDVPFEVIIEQEGVERTDTINLKMFLSEDLWLFRDGEFAHEWEVSKDNTWDMIFDPVLKQFVLTDSPKGLPMDTTDAYLEAKEPILISANSAVLTFDAHWAIESYYDKFIVQVKDDNTEWENLKTEGMLQGIGVKGSRIDSLEWAISSNQPEWIRQECDLDDYMNGNLFLRFGLLTDRGKSFDGIYLNNIRIKYYRDLVYLGANDNNDASSVNIYPNPVSSGSNVYFQVPDCRGEASYNVSDIFGRSISSGIIQPENKIYNLSTSTLQPGIYFVRIGEGENVNTMKLIVVEP